MSGGTSYDSTPYPSQAFHKTHPLNMALPAALYGLGYAQAETARVLEIGCGEGGNIIAMAAAYPNGRFVGFDLAATAIAAGQKVIDALALTNIELLALDIMEAGPKLGQFDYIVAHGVYSWVPEGVRLGVMRLIKQCLAPEGLAFISFNAMPGCHVRLMVREMLLHHLHGVDDPKARIAGAQAFLKLLVDHAQREELSGETLRSFCNRLLERDPNALFHDELGDIYNPLHLHQFAAEASDHSLMLLGESDGQWWREEYFPNPASRAVTDLVGEDRLRLHQYMDYVNVRGFHQFTLAHAGRPIDRAPPYDRLKTLWAQGALSHEGDGADLESDALVEFRLGPGAVIKIGVPVIKQAFAAIAAAWPAAIPVASLPDDPAVAQALLQLFAAGHLELAVGTAPAVAQAGEKPLASALARLQIAGGAARLTGLNHAILELGDPRGRALLSLLDGSRTRAELARELLQDGESFTAALDFVDDGLQQLARLSLLVR